MQQPSPSQPSTTRKIAYIGILALLLFLAMESVLSIVDFQQHGGSPLATIGFLKKVKYYFISKPDTDAFNKAQQLARPDSSEAFNKLVAEESIAANGFSYQPWLGYAAKPFAGKTINVAGFIRKSVPDGTAAADDSNAVTIYFFGGSTLYGFNVADFETIPSQFVQLYKQRGFSTPIRIVNYAVPTYFSYQELMLLTQLLYNNHRPHLAVFFDGLNDGIGIQTTVTREAFLRYRMRIAFNMDIRQGKPGYEDSLNLMFLPAPQSTPQGLADTLFSNYLATNNTIRHVAAAFSVQPYFFIQPVPFYNYPNRSKDPLCSQVERPHFPLLYRQLEQMAVTQTHMRFLGNMLQQARSLPFIDQFHYTPAMNQQIADSMVTQLAPVIDSLYLQKR